MLQDKRVTDVMTPLERVYSLEASVRLNFATMMEIYKSGVLLQDQTEHLQHFHVLDLMQSKARPCASLQIYRLLMCTWPCGSQMLARLGEVCRVLAGKQQGRRCCVQGTPAFQSMRNTLRTSLASSTPKTSSLWTLVILELLCQLHCQTLGQADG